MVSQQKIADWFDTFTTYIADKTDSDILHDPSRLYNADESGFPMCPKSGRVLAERGSQTVYNFSASDKSQITVLACASASGDYTPPMIVFPGSRFKYNPLDGFEEAVLGRTENGWMDAELFVSWLKTCFIPHVDKQAIKKPIILFLDGHSTHLTLEACTVCVENNIVLYCLPSHASHVIQPLDLSLFSPLKHAWRQSVRDFQISNIGECVRKCTFASVFKTAWVRAATTENAKRGFLESGLFPLNPGKVTDNQKLKPSTIFEPCKPVLQSTPVTPSTVRTFTFAPPADTPSQPSATLTSPEYASSPAVQTTLPSPHTDPHAPVQSQTTHSTTPQTDTSHLALHSTPATAHTSSSDAFDKYLVLPKVRSRTQKYKPTVLPKSASGEDIRELLLEKKRKAEEEKQMKESRKRMREEIKLKREEEKAARKALREKEREEKRVQKRKQEDEKKAYKLLKQIEKKSKATLDSDEDLSESEIPYMDDDEYDDDIDFSDDSLRDFCHLCLGRDLAANDDWVGCLNCTKWFHKNCLGYQTLTHQQLADLPFTCDTCS
ncbi:uncharacterized protein [Haliotis cracherodii]|uniref:uncharacterized protein n=1 Tax=Haliotis cracherodii TaxID=6455 RepID=UPI0039EC824E